MIFSDHLVVVRGGGDLATGVVFRLHHAGFPVVVTELERPLTIRRTVAMSSAVLDGSVVVEGVRGVRHDDLGTAEHIAKTGSVPVVVHPGLPRLGQFAVVDARLAKRNIDTTISDAECVVALGPGFLAGTDCHAVVETQRGHRLGRVIWAGPAAADTGVPGTINGRGGERVVRAPAAGVVEWRVAIGDVAAEGDTLGTIDTAAILAPFTGLVRGLIAGASPVPAGLKIADIDPRTDVACDTISDKALAIGGGVVEALLSRLNRSDHSPHVTA